MADTTAATRANLARECEAKLEELLEAADASRVTVRLDLPRFGFHVDDVAAEARRPGVKSLKGQTSIDQRRVPTVLWLMRERRLLVQEDLMNAAPAAPPALIEAYGTTAQMLAPLIIEDVIGWVSVHHNGGRREWRQEEVNALSRTAEWFVRRLEQV